MMLHIPQVLRSDEVRELRQRLESADWVDGQETVGSQGAQFKQNRQLSEESPVAQELGQIVRQALTRNPLFFSAALPLRISPPLFNRYDAAQQEHYGFHVDGAVRSYPAPPNWLRTDLSATLFLCEPDDYEGGALLVRDTFGVREVRLPAGDMVLYAATSLHGVPPLKRGVRIASFFWVQSMIRSAHRRTMLFELDRAIQTLRAQHGETEEAVVLVTHYHNLLREWAEI
ncbi:MAG TPA: Fe2+-dependent dioxygenase [Paraburkholderia sp.]|jgi:PKHD-type hydroxylase